MSTIKYIGISFHSAYATKLPTRRLISSLRAGEGVTLPVEASTWEAFTTHRRIMRGFVSTEK